MTKARNEPFPWNIIIPYLIDISLFLLMLALATIFYCASLFAWSNDTSWFQRSGSLIVLMAAIIEYRELNTYSRDHVHNSILSGAMIHSGMLTSLSKYRKLIGKYGIVYLVLGTLIWGYGDLLFH